MALPILPNDLFTSISAFTGKPFCASKEVQVRSKDIPYPEILESFSKELGQAKYFSLQKECSGSNRRRHFKKLPPEQQIRGICKDILERCCHSSWGTSSRGARFLRTKGINFDPNSKEPVPIFCASTYLEIEQWIKDENLLKCCKRLLTPAEEFTLAGNHAQRAQEARKLLDQKKDSVIDIDLKNLGLTELPPEIFTFRNLVKLEAYDNKIRSFILPHGSLPLLSTLGLSRNQLVCFHIGDNAFQHLQNLHLNGNKISSFEIGTGSLGIVENLNLSDNKLKHFHYGPSEFPMLKELFLYRNPLTSFTLENFQLLKVVELYSCSLRSFKISGSLPALTRLALYNNKLTEVEFHSGSLPQLESLKLNNNRLTQCIFHQGAVPQLWELELCKNKLKDFNPQAGVLPNLVALDLSDNQIEAFNPESNTFPSLGYLAFESNFLKRFDPQPGALLNLKRLYLSNNQLARFDIERGVYPNLRELWLKNNQLRRFKPHQGSLPQLIDLNLSMNQIEQFIAKPGRYPSLTLLVLDKNKIKQFEAQAGAFPNLKILEIQNNNLTKFNPGPGIYPCLQKLQLDNNSITEFNPTGSDTPTFPALISLHLDGNALTVFAPSIRIPYLDMLCLNKNKLRDFNYLYDYDKTLIIQLGDNRLESFRFNSKQSLRRPYWNFHHTSEGVFELRCSSNFLRVHMDSEDFICQLHERWYSEDRKAMLKGCGIMSVVAMGITAATYYYNLRKIPPAVL